MASQEGCFQYFTGETGTIESYGLQSSGMLAQMNYGICIRYEQSTIWIMDIQLSMFSVFCLFIIQNFQLLAKAAIL